MKSVRIGRVSNNETEEEETALARRISQRCVIWRRVRGATPKPKWRWTQSWSNRSLGSIPY